MTAEYPTRNDPVDMTENDTLFEWVFAIRDRLWADEDSEGRLFYNPDKEWGPGTVEEISTILDALRPRNPEVYT